MLQPGRHANSSEYRYGFNGMEKDDEIKGSGNSYTTEFRQYDSRLGRWLSMDPLFRNFPWQSPYVAFDNNPILKTDPRGDAARDPQKKVDRQNRRFSRLEKRLARKYEEGSEEYNYELLKRASKKRYGSKSGESVLSSNNKQGRTSSSTNWAFDTPNDTRKSEFDQVSTMWYSDYATDRGTEGALGGNEKSVTLENVKDGEELLLKAKTFAGFQVQVFVNGEQVESFEEAPQVVTARPDDAVHPRHTQIKTLKISTGSTKPQTVTITFRTVFTKNGAAVHHRTYAGIHIISKVGVARKLNGK